MVRRRPLPRGQLYFEPVKTAQDLVETLVGHRAREGEQVAKFEQACAATFGAGNVIALPHARVALSMLLEHYRFRPGSEVILSPVTIADVVNVILEHGLVPRFVDLGARTCSVDVECLENAVTRRTCAILVTHLCGLLSDMPSILAIAERRSLVVLEDASQAMGASLNGRYAGTFGAAGFFSLTTLKPMSSFIGGLTLTDDPELARYLRRRNSQLRPVSHRQLAGLFVRDLALHAASSKRTYTRSMHAAVGRAEQYFPNAVREFQRGNLVPWRRRPRAVRRALPAYLFRRFSDAQALMALRALMHLEHDNATRAQLVDTFYRASSPAVRNALPIVPRKAVSTWWRLPLFTHQPDQLKAALHRDGIDTTSTNLICATAERAFASFWRDTPNARQYTNKMLFLPMHPNLTPAEIGAMARYVEAHQDFLATGAEAA